MTVNGKPAGAWKISAIDEGIAVIKSFMVPQLTNPFSDVKETDYFYDPVLWAVAENITIGVDANHFAPDASCTRAQMATFLWRAAGRPQPQGNSNPFVDVKSTDYYYDAVRWAVGIGIINGVDATHFAPDMICNRAHMVTLLYRFSGNPPVSGSNPFVDVKTTDYYYDAVRWAVQSDLVKGVDATHYNPNGTCTRGQIVTFLYRYMK